MKQDMAIIRNRTTNGDHYFLKDFHGTAYCNQFGHIDWKTQVHPTYLPMFLQSQAHWCCAFRFSISLHIFLLANLTQTKNNMIQTPVIVTFANQKGGVGKTTLCVTFANYLVTKGVRLVVIDCDFQHSIMKCRKSSASEISSMKREDEHLRK